MTADVLQPSGWPLRCHAITVSGFYDRQQWRKSRDVHGRRIGRPPITDDEFVVLKPSGASTVAPVFVAYFV